MSAWQCRVSFLCWLLGHDEPLWGIGEKGIVWRCPDCGRETPSCLKHQKKPESFAKLRPLS